MKVLTKDLERRLLTNGSAPSLSHVPLVKLFNPLSAATWLVTEMADDGDSLFGLADLGVGSPELGWFSRREIERLRLPFGLRIERDMQFRTEHSIAVWADHARVAGSIAEADRLLQGLSGP
ncbi:DUF2958 domain-containing protein [Sphingomonas sp. KRR8]|uniref:DUF2958 domain-containing protein n=1 Tax=Sphingomonas sp. KRR8 TaxID=2942996 RepID=UPI00201FEB76|nr:DUF2958 domain-containing protein [Sphingomonas sp. KRR8]URD62344.1 DUF2958 domain-containing protein [Sphingomonas sp. KRR8]